MIVVSLRTWRTKFRVSLKRAVSIRYSRSSSRPSLLQYVLLQPSTLPGPAWCFIRARATLSRLLIGNSPATHLAQSWTFFAGSSRYLTYELTPDSASNFQLLSRASNDVGRN